MKTFLKHLSICLLSVGFLLLANCGITEVRAETNANQFMDLFMDTPIIGTLDGTCWGAAETGPRDQSNGIEDLDCSKYSYWDGGIIKDDDGIYHMYGSRWDQSLGHEAWQNHSYAFHATSNNLYGPFTDQGLIWPNELNGGKGHNISVLRTHDGQYAITTSGTDEAGNIFLSDSPNGPWTRKSITLEDPMNYQSFSLRDNFRTILRPDGGYLAITSRFAIATADRPEGPYTVQTPSMFSHILGCPSQYMEDPLIFYSGDKYHVIFNNWYDRKAYHFVSADGIHNWKMMPGYAYEATTPFIRYEDGTINTWYKMERPSVYINESGVVEAMTFAVINAPKEQDLGNDQNNSKIIVVPFDGAGLNEFTQREGDMKPRSGSTATDDSTIQSWNHEKSRNYGGREYISILRNTSNPSYGVFGEGITGTDTDCKIGFLRFDLSEYDLEKVEEATLSLVYSGMRYPKSGTNAIEVALTSGDWKEGIGNEGNQFITSAPADITWNNRPEIIGENDGDLASSEEFQMERPGTEVTVDVTALLKKLAPEATTLDLAFCDTKGEEIYFCSKEFSDDNAPKLIIKEKADEPVVISPADKSELQQLIKEAEQLSLSEYTPESWAALKNALEAARLIAADQELTIQEQSKVDAAAKALRRCIHELVKKPAPPVSTPDDADDGPNDNGDAKLPPVDKTPQKGEIYTVGSYQYKITSTKSKTVTVVGVRNKKMRKITIKDAVKIKGSLFTVTAIGKSAFSNCKKATQAVIGKNVKTIEAKAFYNCKKLKTLKVKSRVLKKIKKNAFKNLHSKSVVKVPRKKWKSYKKLFKHVRLKKYA